jgi:hypothetical protein
MSSKNVVLHVASGDKNFYFRDDKSYHYNQSYCRYDSCGADACDDNHFGTWEMKDKNQKTISVQIHKKSWDDGYNAGEKNVEEQTTFELDHFSKDEIKINKLF